MPLISTVSEIPGCEGCPMRRLFPENPFVPRQRPNPAHDLVRLVIAEAPGEEESKKGQPLVGKAGKVFNSLLECAEILREGLTITNCQSCRPCHNVFPTDSKARSYISKEDAHKAVQQCKQAHLDPLLRSRKWKRVDLLGGKALQIVAGMEGITKWRGRPLTLLPSRHKAIAIFHPSHLDRPWNKKNKQMREQAVNDLTKSLDEPAE